MTFNIMLPVLLREYCISGKTFSLSLSLSLSRSSLLLRYLNIQEIECRLSDSSTMECTERRIALNDNYGGRKKGFQDFCEWNADMRIAEF